MLRKIILVLAILNLVAAGLPAKESDKEDRPRNIILIGWDGAQRDHVNESLKRNELPNLKKLSEEGTYVEIDIEGATDTKAGWAQILTGYYPTITGVYSNGRYQPIPKGLTVFERLEKHFGPVNIVTLAVIGKKGNVDAGGPKKVKVKEQEDKGGAKRKQPRRAVGKIIEEEGVKYRLIPGKPYYYTKDNMDLFENGLKLDEKVGTRAIELLEKHKEQRFFLFIHFAEVDQKGHKHGENSQEYGEALASADLWTGRIMEKLKALGLYDKTLIYVTADHGFDEGAKKHRNAPHVFLATNDKRVIRHGLRQDITPTILERFGVEPGNLEPPLDGLTLGKPCKRPKPVLGPQGTSKDTAKPGRKSRSQEQRRPRANLMGAGFDNWFDKLTRAYEQNDREKMGRLLERMRRHRQRMQKGRTSTLGPMSEPQSPSGAVKV
ncbi:MAG: alkaline phosphatase family protein [Planctomycetota bacterium]|jgi:hypothetical protein